VQNSYRQRQEALVVQRVAEVGGVPAEDEALATITD
jgi:hypothetical protein